MEMLLAAVAADPGIVIKPEVSITGIGIIVTILIASIGGSWWFTKLFSQFQVSFSEMKLGLLSVQNDLTNYKSSQDLKLDAVHVELKKQTEILIKQEVLSDRMNQMVKTQDRYQEHLDNLESAFRNFRVGSHISEQAQVGRRAT